MTKMWIVFGAAKVVRRHKALRQRCRREAIDNVIVKKKEDTE